jgi:spore maturation protein CgeB
MAVASPTPASTPDLPDPTPDARRLRLAFFGSSLVSAYWNGAATYYRGVLRALHERGYDITFYEPDAYDRQAHRDLPEDPPYAKVVVYDADAAALPPLLEAARSADVVVKASGVGVLDTELEAAVAQLVGPGVRVFWDVDAPATLARVHADADDPFRVWLPNYDHVLTYGGGDPVVRAYTQLGAQNCTPIYNAHDPETHHPPNDTADARERFGVDLAFLGNRLPDREARVDDFFFDAAQRCPDRTFLLGGSGWEDKAMPDNVRYLGHVGTDDHNAFNAGPRAVLNISRASMAATGFSPATRVFEACAAGACLITDAWTGVEAFFEPDREILVAADGAAVAAHLAALDAERAAVIGAAARERTLRDHTYARRAAEADALFRRALKEVAA